MKFRRSVLAFASMGVFSATAVSVACGDDEGPLFVGDNLDGSFADVRTDTSPGDAAAVDSNVIQVDGDAADATPACTAQTDTTANPDHCGRCFHSCGGGICSASVCQPFLIATSPTPFGIAVYQDRVYWGRRANATDAGSIRSTKVDGTGLVLVPENSGAVNGVFVDAHGIVYADTAGGRILQTPNLATPPTVRHAEGKIGANDVVADGDQILWTDINAPGLFRASRNGTEPAVNLAPAPTSYYPFGIALRDEYVYWSNIGTQVAGPDAGAPDGTVLRTKKDGTQATPETVMSGLRYPIYLDIDSTDAYVADFYADAVIRAPRAGGAAVRFAEVVRPYAVALDADNIYVSESGSSGFEARILAMRKDGTGGVKVLATNLVMPTKIVLDDNFVYWANQAGGTVMKVAKP